MRKEKCQLVILKASLEGMSSNSTMSFWSSTGRADSLDGLVIASVRAIMRRLSMKSFRL
jgi:hypothetical protein